MCRRRFKADVKYLRDEWKPLIVIYSYIKRVYHRQSLTCAILIACQSEKNAHSQKIVKNKAQSCNFLLQRLTATLDITIVTTIAIYLLHTLSRNMRIKYGVALCQLYPTYFIPVSLTHVQVRALYKRLRRIYIICQPCTEHIIERTYFCLYLHVGKGKPAILTRSTSNMSTCRQQLFQMSLGKGTPE